MKEEEGTLQKGTVEASPYLFPWLVCVGICLSLPAMPSCHCPLALSLRCGGQGHGLSLAHVPSCQAFIIVQGRSRGDRTKAAIKYYLPFFCHCPLEEAYSYPHFHLGLGALEDFSED